MYKITYSNIVEKILIIKKEYKILHVYILNWKIHEIMYFKRAG